MYTMNPTVTHNRPIFGKEGWIEGEEKSGCVGCGVIYVQGSLVCGGETEFVYGAEK